MTHPIVSGGHQKTSQPQLYHHGVPLTKFFIKWCISSVEKILDPESVWNVVNLNSSTFSYRYSTCSSRFRIVWIHSFVKRGGEKPTVYPTVILSFLSAYPWELFQSGSSSLSYWCRFQYRFSFMILVLLYYRPGQRHRNFLHFGLDLHRLSGSS